MTYKCPNCGCEFAQEKPFVPWETKNHATITEHRAGEDSLQDVDGRMKRRSDCMRALQCLYIAVDAGVAKDVNEKVCAYIRDIETEHSPIGALTDGGRAQ